MSVLSHQQNTNFDAVLYLDLLDAKTVPYPRSPIRFRPYFRRYYFISTDARENKKCPINPSRPSSFRYHFGTVGRNIATLELVLFLSLGAEGLSVER